MKIDAETTISLLLMALMLLNHNNVYPAILFIVGSIITVISAPISVYFGLRKEIKVVQIIYLILNAIFPLFVITNVRLTFILTIGCIDMDS